MLRERSTTPGARALWLAVALVGVAACTSYVSKSGVIRDSLATDNYEGALAAIEDISQSNSKLLYLYEKGLVLHARGDLVESSKAFSESELVLEDLYTRSITREVASLTVSETIAQYRGDAFEAMYVHYYQILNYLGMGDVEGAMVECRRVNRKLQTLADGGETYFSNDPFIQYLTGIVYDMGGEREPAGVSYRVAAELYEGGEFAPVAPLPPPFFCDAETNALARGDREEMEGYRREPCPSGADSGRVSIFIECGQIIRKREAGIVLPIFESDRWNDNEKFANELYRRHNVRYGPQVRVKYWLKVALPVLEPMPPRYLGALVRARPVGGGNDALAEGALAADLDALAEQAYREKQSTVFVRAIVRAIVKYIAQQSADNQDEGLGALVNLFNVVTETADTRSWSSLPSRVYLARLNLPAGRYRLEINVPAATSQMVRTFVFDDVEVLAGGHVVKSARAF